VNVCGRKRWLLFPPGEEVCLQDRFGQLAYDATAPEVEDEKMYPRYKDLCNCEEIIQEAGEAIFIPSGWHHQVWNLVSMSKYTDEEAMLYFQYDFIIT
jgi:hypothetical protein